MIPYNIASDQNPEASDVTNHIYKIQTRANKVTYDVPVEKWPCDKIFYHTKLVDMRCGQNSTLQDNASNRWATRLTILIK
jgi:hypothetical protein